MKGIIRIAALLGAVVNVMAAGYALEGNWPRAGTCGIFGFTILLIAIVFALTIPRRQP